MGVSEVVQHRLPNWQTLRRRAQAVGAELHRREPSRILSHTCDNVYPALRVFGRVIHILGVILTRGAEILASFKTALGWGHAVAGRSPLGAWGEHPPISPDAPRVPPVRCAGAGLGLGGRGGSHRGLRALRSKPLPATLRPPSRAPKGPAGGGLPGRGPRSVSRPGRLLPAD